MSENNKKEREVRDEENEEETETEDIYDEKQLEEMLENDEITEAEYSFMLGREKVRKKKKGLGLEKGKHHDTVADHLAENEYIDD
jgi:hypothetical protein